MIIFFYGEDTFRSRKKLKELKEKFLREVDSKGLGLTVLDGERADWEKINQAIGAASLLSRKRLVIIENIFNNKNEIIFRELPFYLKDKKRSQGDNIIVFWDSLSGSGQKLSQAKADLFKMLAKQKYAQEFKPLSNSETAAWVKKEIESRGGKISRPAVLILSALLGSDLWQINNEIDKLVNYKAGQKLHLAGAEEAVTITEADVKEIVQGVFDEKVFALTDAISNKNKKLAVKLYEEQLESGKSDDYLFNMILRQFRILLTIRQALDSGFSARKIASTLKLHPFVAQKSIIQVRNFSLVGLKDILGQLVRIDYLVKSGRLDGRAALSSLIVRL